MWDLRFETRFYFIMCFKATKHAHDDKVETIRWKNTPVRSITTMVEYIKRAARDKYSQHIALSRIN